MNNGYSICFNKWVLDNNIKNEFRLLLIISSLTAKTGYCFATNKYLADIFNETEISISNKIKKLEKNNYIEIEYEKRGCEIVSRKIRLKNILIDDKKIFYSTVKKNFKDNNIISNNINNNINIYCREVIDYLNSKTKKHFKYTQNNINKIKTRLNEGFTVEECKIVIDKKTDEWLNNENMNQYLRPETLFGSKFESYLNQNKINSNIPEWFNKEIQKEKPTEKEQEELENIINELI